MDNYFKKVMDLKHDDEIFINVMNTDKEVSRREDLEANILTLKSEITKLVEAKNFSAAVVSESQVKKIAKELKDARKELRQVEFALQMATVASEAATNNRDWEEVGKWDPIVTALTTRLTSYHAQQKALRSAGKKRTRNGDGPAALVKSQHPFV